LLVIGILRRPKRGMSCIAAFNTVARESKKSSKLTYRRYAPKTANQGVYHN
jgi:hypothetical protein